jgi:gliding motility-associated-like protein
MLLTNAIVRIMAVIALTAATLQVNAQPGTWTWMHGTSSYNAPGNSGTQGVFAPANYPPALYEACEWTDADGNFWLFGGLFDANNMMWKFDVSLNQWAWMTGTLVQNAPPVYGTQGVPSVTNTPSCRTLGTLTWTDRAGNLWLFGGYGQDVNGVAGMMSELWKFNPLTLEWTWVRGSNLANALGSYGYKGIASPGNDPPSRCETGASWTDSNGDLWLFGGQLPNGFANDVWKYNIATNQWTWMSGAQYGAGAPSYGQRGVESPSNDPGGRSSYAKGVDVYGCFYIYGGGKFNGVDYSDMWRYNPSTGYWTWFGGLTTVQYTGQFPGECDHEEENDPGSGFEMRNSWYDSSGIWLFGGGTDVFNNPNALWHFDFYTQSFALMKGNQPISYGAITVPAATNMPPPRKGGVSWKDSNGDLWMFGGVYLAASINDLWKFEIDSTCVGEYHLPPPPPSPSDYQLQLPNVFTPDGDGINDEFSITGMQPGDQLEIFDRWGVRVYVSSAGSFSWNGNTTSGNACSDGVYYYIITRTGQGSQKGFLQLIR